MTRWVGFLMMLVSGGLCFGVDPIPANDSQSRTGVLVRWPENLPSFIEEGLTQSRANGKPILIDFTAQWCGPCKVMDRKVFPDARVASEMEHWVKIKIDRDKYPQIASSFSISGLPTYLLIDKDGVILGKTIGLQMAEDFAEWLSAARAKKL